MIHERIEKAHVAVKDFDRAKGRWKAWRNEALWLKDANRYKKSTFAPNKKWSSSIEITKLIVEDGIIQKEWEGLANIATTWFKKLLIADGNHRSNIIQEVLMELDTRIT